MLILNVAAMFTLSDREQGLPPDLSRYVAEQLTARDPLGAHAEAELGIDLQQLAPPGHTAFASFLSLMAGPLTGLPAASTAA